MKPNEPRDKPKHHAFTPRKFMPWVMCRKCGLVLLRNKRTEKARAKPCPDD